MACAAALGLANGTALAQAPSAAPTATQVNAQKVVADVRRIIAANYVLADVRPKLDSALAQGLAAGHYNVSDPNDLAARINEDMKAVAHDKHLGISYNPQKQAELAARPPGAGADDAPPTPEEIHQAIQFNHGILEMKVLPGNIRYINLVGFMWGGKKTAEAYDNAIRFLQDGDAAVIDLRQNGGGSPDAVQYLISHFLPANRPIVTFYMGANKVDHLSSLASLPAGRLIGKPLYVLTSGGTASAAEEFTGHVAGFKLGEIIGENTAGAGFRNEFFPVSGGYVISVSVGRAVLASTGKDWEGVGIAPTTKIDADKALDVAQVHALRQIASKATGDDKRVLESQAAILEAKVNPVPTPLPAERYAGKYDGERSVTVEDGTLNYQRAGGHKVAMISLGANEFGFSEDPMARIRFTVTGANVTALKVIRGDGSTADAPRLQ
jgi:C-terminal processing protease CtpA/Prc